MSRLFLSPPDVGILERGLLLDAFDSNWIAPTGPHVDAFESEMARYLGIAQCAALSSGTAGIHLALRLLGVGPGDEVVLPTFTFVATAAAATYQGARPVLIDSDPNSWNLDPDLLAEELAESASRGRLPAAVVSVDLYGQCACYSRISELCDEYQVPLVEDAAEALGASYKGVPAGRFGRLAAFSFNGNKIITTGGGGMLASSDEALMARARHLASQAREPVTHYEHNEIGYNYRMGNLSAAVGRGQLAGLGRRLQRRREINADYRRILGDLSAISFLPIDPDGEPNHWLTVLRVDPASTGVDREKLRVRLEEANIESRPTWKPLHLQPALAGCRKRGGQVSEAIFSDGLCLPSGSAMTEEDLERVTSPILELLS